MEQESRRAQARDYIQVVLKQHELEYAYATGVMRYHEARRLGLSSIYAAEERDQQSAAAELAFAIALNLSRQLTVNKFKEPDVEGWQVRSTSYASGRLMVRPGDSDTEPFVLVRGAENTWEVVGWLWGKDAKQPQWAANPGGKGICWMVPASELLPIKWALYRASPLLYILTPACDNRGTTDKRRYPSPTGA